ncbi:monocarboxylate transporter 6 [Microcaecilia unicolor]|uniref:Monocarboxylate transporter 6 n=1 Tax=Microcaecilia unicolor TaxID=1415580 RepID=A0A6P7YM15_9AMPH|nr:monocarboxylate transporter 6 [Microcaecilia unicolor]XP_030064171.1 monocarboxylate transporter 6 [Microcaecilia unicolor]
MTLKERGKSEVPEGRWAWVVLVAVVTSQGLSLGFPSCVGVFYSDIQHAFQATNSETAWFPSIVTAVLHAGGPFCSILVERYGCRFTVILGGLLSGVGMLASSFSQSIGQLYVTGGFIAGLGLCFTFQAGVTVLGYYFIRRRTLANALAATGASVGMAIWPLFSQYLLVEMGWRGSFLIFGGVLLNSCVCGALMRPVRAHPALQSPTEDCGQLQCDQQPDSDELISHKEPLKESLFNGTSVDHDKTQFQSMTSSCMMTVKKYMAFDLFCQNKRFQVFTVGVAWLVMGFVLPLFYLVPYATSSNIEESKAAFLLALIGFINIFIRPIAGVVSGMRFFKEKMIYVFSTAVLVNGISNFISAVSSSYSMLILYCVVYSVSMSFIGALIFQVLMDIVGMKRFPSAFGLFTILESITILTGPPLAGLLVDFTGQYNYIFYACAINGILVGLFLSLSSYALDRKEAKMKATRGLPLKAIYTEVPVKSEVTSRTAPEII